MAPFLPGLPDPSGWGLASWGMQHPMGVGAGTSPHWCWMDPWIDLMSRAAWIHVSSEVHFESPMQKQQNWKGNVILSETVVSARILPLEQAPLHSGYPADPSPGLTGCCAGANGQPPTCHPALGLGCRARRNLLPGWCLPSHISQSFASSSREISFHLVSGTKRERWLLPPGFLSTTRQCKDSPPPSGAGTHGCWERDGRLTPLRRAAGPSELLPSPAEQQSRSSRATASPARDCLMLLWDCRCPIASSNTG